MLLNQWQHITSSIISAHTQLHHSWPHAALSRRQSRQHNSDVWAAQMQGHPQQPMTTPLHLQHPLLTDFDTLHLTKWFLITLTQTSRDLKADCIGTESTATLTEKDGNIVLLTHLNRFAWRSLWWTADLKVYVPTAWPAHSYKVILPAA